MCLAATASADRRGAVGEHDEADIGRGQDLEGGVSGAARSLPHLLYYASWHDDRRRDGGPCRETALVAAGQEPFFDPLGMRSSSSLHKDCRVARAAMAFTPTLKSWMAVIGAVGK